MGGQYLQAAAAQYHQRSSINPMPINPMPRLSGPCRQRRPFMDPHHRLIGSYASLLDIPGVQSASIPEMWKAGLNTMLRIILERSILRILFVGFATRYSHPNPHPLGIDVEVIGIVWSILLRILSRVPRSVTCVLTSTSSIISIKKVLSIIELLRRRKHTMKLLKQMMYTLPGGDAHQSSQQCSQKGIQSSLVKDIEYVEMEQSDILIKHIS